MSASDTGEDAPLVQFFNSVRNNENASWPASRTESCNNSTSRAKFWACMFRSCTLSASAKRQPLDAHGRRVDAIAEFQIVGGRHRLEDFEQMARDRHLAHRVGHLAVLDPEAGCAAAVVAGDTIDAGADQVGDVEALLDISDQLLRRRFTSLEMQIIRPRRRRRGDAAMSMAGGG